MRMDSPACLNCRNEVVNISENNLFLSTFGILSHQPLKWQLELELEKPILTNESFWYFEAVGTMFFNLSKVEKGVLWYNLEKVPKKKYYIWWDMRAKHNEDMD
jgi:hypothetical protein